MTWLPGVILPPEKLAPELVETIKVALSPAQTVGLTAFREAEARLEPGHGWVPNPIDAMQDIMCVIDNRAKDPRWTALGHKGVCLQRAQFSCWMRAGGEANFLQLMHLAQLALAGQPLPSKLESCIKVAQSVLNGYDGDLIDGATHYYAPASMVPAGRVPNWVLGATMTVERFGHKFYAGVK